MRLYTKRGRKHRKQRERKARVGDLIQIDTSPLDWMGTGEKYHLVVAVDGSVIVRHKNSKESIPHKILELHKIREYKHTKENDLARYEYEAA